MHPKTTKEDVFVFEINLDKLLSKKVGKMIYKEISKYPNIKKDLAFIVNKDVEAHTRTSFWEKESLATTVNAAKTTMHKNIALNHFITRTKLIKGKCMDFHSINPNNKHANNTNM